MSSLTFAKTLTIVIALLLTVCLTGGVAAQPAVGDVKLGEVSHNQPDDADMGVSYTLSGSAEATRTAVAWYKNTNPLMDLYMVYEGGSSNAQLDLSGNVQTVTAGGDIAASTAWDATGGHGGSGAFLYSAGTGNAFYLDAGTVMNTGAYTKACWLRRIDVTGSSHNILSAGTGTGYHVLYAGGSANGYVTAFHFGQSVKVADPVALIDDVWYHYAVTYDGTTGDMLLYRDGAPVASGTAPAFSDQTLFVGGFTTGVGNMWEGYLDDVRIYDHVLSSEQILALYNGSGTIRSTETTAGEDWQAEVTPFSASEEPVATAVLSNTLTIATDPPIVGDIPDEQVVEDVPFFVIDLNTLVDDANHADNEIMWTYSGNTDLTVDITAGLATIDAPDNWFGDETITFRATDPDANYNEDAATFEATSVNDPPEVVSPIDDVLADENDPPINDHADLNVVFTDVEDAGNLTFAVASNTNPSLVTVTIDPGDMLDLEFSSDQNGTATITIQATDIETRASVTDEFLVDVQSGNDAPVVIAPIDDLAADEDDPAIDNYVDLNDVFSDTEDGSALDFQVLSNSNPSLVTVAIDIDNALDLSFASNGNGTATIIIRATDSQLEFVDDEFIVDVAAVNDAPVVSDIPGQTINEGGSFAAIDLNTYVTDVDNIPADITWTYLGNVTLGVSIDGSNVATVTAPGAWTGTETITFTAEDLGLLTDYDPADFTVVPLVPPTVSGVVLSSTSGEDLVSDDLEVTFTLGGGASRSGVAWTKDSAPWMLLYMPFEGGPTNALSDLSGNNHTVGLGTDAVVSAEDAWKENSGRGSTGAYTYGTSVSSFYLDAGSIFPTSSSYSKFCWVKRAGISSLNILSGSIWGSGSGGHVLFASQSQNFHLAAGQNGTPNFVLDPGDPLAEDVWYHVGVTFDYATGEMILYKDGQPVDVETLSGADLEVTDDILLVGALTDGDGNQWKGQIDNVRIFDFVVSPAQVAEFYTSEGLTIQSDETTVGDVWCAVVTPFSTMARGGAGTSNCITIVEPCCENRGNIDHLSDTGGPIDVSDLTYFVEFMFNSGPPAPCEEEADVNDDGPVDISDLTYLVEYLFGGGPPPPPC